MSKILAPGVSAPDFTLHVTPEKTISLSEFKGKPVILAFYPADWSPVCSTEMTSFNEVLPEFQKYGAVLLGISVDGCWCHNTFAKNNNLNFALLSDSEPKGKVARMYGAYNEQAGVCERALFVVDKNGTIAWSYLSPMKENPGSKGILEALEKLST